MEMSPTIASLASALAKFQGEVNNPKNTDVNPQFRSRYAPLDVVINTIKPVMTKHGLSFTQFAGTGAEPETVTITTLLMHESGEWIKSDTLTLPAYQIRKDSVKEYSAQGAGIAISYGRRYQLGALIGIASEDDDDAAGLGQQTGGYTQQPARQQQSAPSQSQASAIKDKMSSKAGEPVTYDPARYASGKSLWIELQGTEDGYGDYVTKNGLEKVITALEARKAKKAVNA